MDMGIYGQNAVTTVILFFLEIIVSPLNYLEPADWPKYAILHISVPPPPPFSVPFVGKQRLYQPKPTIPQKITVVESTKGTLWDTTKGSASELWKHCMEEKLHTSLLQFICMRLENKIYVWN